MVPRVHNRHHGTAPADAVYVGRGTPWGNPFRLGPDGDRIEVLAKFQAHVAEHPELAERARQELSGRDLVCSCHPQPCHADLWLAVANDLEYQLPVRAGPAQLGLEGL